MTCVEEKYKVNSNDVNIKGKYGIPNLSNLSKISEIWVKSGFDPHPHPSNPLWTRPWKEWQTA